MRNTIKKIMIFLILILFSSLASANSDSYETDNTYNNANLIATNGTIQTHTFYPSGDIDYIKFEAKSGSKYIIETQNNSDIDITDTEITLYSTDGTTKIDYNDDLEFGGIRTSRIFWEAPQNGTYYVKVKELYGSENGSYNILVKRIGHLVPYLIYPTESINMTRNSIINIQTGVRCEDGICENINAILDPENSEPEEKEIEEKTELEVTEKIKEEGEARVIILLEDEELNEEPITEDNLEIIKEKIDNTQEEVLENLNVKEEGEFSITNMFEKPDIEILHKYETINAISGEISEKGLQKLIKNKKVKKIMYDREMKISLNDSTKIINASKTWNTHIEGTNITGEGITVCVIDTGIDYTHEDLGNCSSSDFLNGNCEKTISGYDFVNGDNNPIDDGTHGTHVAGIIASTNEKYPGVARGSKLVALKACNAAGSCYSSAMMASVDWCVSNSSKLNISVISMSIGDGREYGPTGSNGTCASWLDTPFKAAKNRGMFIAVASGNEYHYNGFSYPACSPYAMSVGSTTKSDTLSSFGNRGEYLDFLAPGSNIMSTNTGGSQRLDSGTSMATPHISGAAALIQQYYKLSKNKTISPDEIKYLLRFNGKDIDDSGNSDYSYPRIDIQKALLSKGVVSTTVGAKPFYSISKNPQNESCLEILNDGETCNQTWIINATNEDSNWEFFTIYENEFNINITPKFIINIRTDLDGDGYYSDQECNDYDASINPNATELCDSIDNNCDGNIDESSVCCKDSDNDGINETIINGSCSSNFDLCVGENKTNIPQNTSCTSYTLNSSGCHQAIYQIIGTRCKTPETLYSCIWGHDPNDDVGIKFFNYTCNGLGTCSDTQNNWTTFEECTDLQYCIGVGQTQNSSEFYCSELPDTDEDGLTDDIDFCINEGYSNLPNNSTCRTYFLNSSGCHDFHNDLGITICNSSYSTNRTCSYGFSTYESLVSWNTVQYCGNNTGLCDGRISNQGNANVELNCSSTETCNLDSKACEDITNPNITIIYPSNNQNIITSKSSIQLNVLFSELVNSSYQLNLNKNLTLCNNCKNITKEISLEYGINNLSIIAKDLVNRKSRKNILFNLTLDSDEDSIPDYNDTDDDNDGTLDELDFINGNLSNIYSNIENLSLVIDNNESINLNITNGTHNLNFKNNNQTIVSFDYLFNSSNKLNFANISIITQENNASLGYIIVKGINLDLVNTRKTILLERISNYDSVCIHDAELNDINEISEECNQENEYKVECDGTNQNGYTCSENNRTYTITGLRHSGIEEIDYTPPLVEEIPQEQRPSGGSGTSSAFKYNCSEWSMCYPNGTMIQLCKKLTYAGILISTSTTTKSCNYTSVEDIKVAITEEKPETIIKVIENVPDKIVDKAPPKINGTQIGQLYEKDEITWKWNGDEWIQEEEINLEIIEPVEESSFKQKMNFIKEKIQYYIMDKWNITALILFTFLIIGIIEIIRNNKHNWKKKKKQKKGKKKKK